MKAVSRAAGTVRQFVSRRQAAAAPFALVLLYHRIAEVADDPWDLAVSPANFAAQLEVLRRFAPCLGFGAALDALAGDRPPRSAVCVTFDDGYRDNLRAGLPLLEAAGVPATVFVTSGTVGQGRGYWWDTLVRLVLSPAALPERLSIEIDGRRMDLPTGARGSATRRQSFDRLRAALLPLPLDAIEGHLDRIAAWSGQDTAGPAEDRPMDADELSRLAASPLIEIGGHTRTHPPLTMIGADAAAREIAEGRRALMEVTGRAVTSFAYPYGKHDHAVVRMTAAAGFRHAGTVRAGVATAATPPLRVPRVQVRNWTAEVFESRLRDYVGRNATPPDAARATA